MNAIGFVFCVLTILSIEAILSFEKQVSAHRLRSSYVGHAAANRQILDQITSRFYASLKQPSSSDDQEEKIAEEPQNPISLPPPPLINPHCARINLFPLIKIDVKEEPYLYETAAKLLRIFYGKALFDHRERAEYKFLDALLKEVRHQIVQEKFSVPEKVSFKDPHFQMIYYKMLKGTKKNDLLQEMGYPSLLDYIKIENAPSRICLCHAHPNLLAVLFTPKGAAKLYAAMHTPKAPLISQESIERICQEVHAPLLNPKIFDLIEISQGRHSSASKDTLFGEDLDNHISLRKVVAIHHLEKNN